MILLIRRKDERQPRSNHLDDLPCLDNGEFVGALIKSGSCGCMPNNVVHGFKNGSDTDQLVFLCNVPPRGDVNPLQNDNQPE